MKAVTTPDIYKTSRKNCLKRSCSLDLGHGAHFFRHCGEYRWNWRLDFEGWKTESNPYFKFMLVLRGTKSSHVSTFLMCFDTLKQFARKQEDLKFSDYRRILWNPNHSKVQCTNMRYLPDRDVYQIQNVLKNFISFSTSINLNFETELKVQTR